MAIEKMNIISITGKFGDLDSTILKCCENGNFHPESPSNLMDKSSNLLIADQESPYSAMSKKLDDFCLDNKIITSCDIKGDYSFDLLSANEYLQKLYSDTEAIDAQILSAKEQQSQYQNILKHIVHIIGLDYSFEDIFSCKFIDVRFGRIPNDGFEKLSFYSEKPFYFLAFDEDDDYHWGVYFVPSSQCTEIDYLFRSLYFERVYVPDFVHGTPEQAKKDFEEKLANIDKTISFLTAQKTDLIEKEKATIIIYATKLQILTNCYDLRKFVMCVGNCFHIEGFVPCSEAEKFIKSFDTVASVDVLASDYTKGDPIPPPVKLKNNRFVKPFEFFVEMFGTPGYNEIDPTPFVSITYTILFGLMFGDVGQGLVISLIGYLMYRFKKMQLGKIMIRIGFSSAIFGFIYGSVFGMEHLLDPLYLNVLGMSQKPIEVLAPDKTNFILFSAIGIGVLIIMISLMLNIYVGIKQKDVKKAIFSQNGLSGLVLYSFAIIGAVLLLLFNVNIFNVWFIIFFLVLPIICIFCQDIFAKIIMKKKNIKPESGIGGFIVETFFEMFEILLSYVTNTMSFLRIAGFVLSHAGMMTVVFTLADLVGGTGSIPVIIIGNIFVLAMEGLIVGIQVLRLEFFEIFSRFYGGEGRAFSPVQLNKKPK